MTTCPRCGQPLRAPVAACPRCGQRFAQPAQPPQSAPQQNGYGGYNGNQGYNTYDDATPAWMQQARPQPPQPPQPPRQPQRPNQQAPQQPPAYGQPAPQQGARPGFSVNELVSEEALPDWLKQASADSAQPTQRQPTPGTPYRAQQAPQAPQPYPPANVPAIPASSPAYPVAYPPANQPAYGGFAPMPGEEPPAARPDASAFPSIESAGSYQAPLAGGGGLSAGSLLDPNALPGWLSGQQGQAASVSMRSGEGMRAQSLIDDTALPEWIRNEPQGNGNGTAGAAALAPARAALPPAAPAWGGYPVPAPVSPAAPALPAYPAAPAAPMAPTAGTYPQAGYGSMQPPALTPMDGRMNGQMNGQQGFSARDLVDPDAMPSWAQPAPGARAAQPQGGAGQWSASDLIDPAMLPGWVRENDAATPQGGAQPGLTGQPAPAAMPSSPAYDAPPAPRERTGRVPAPQGTRPGGGSRVPDPEQAEQDFSASRAGVRGSASRKYPAARPLNDGEKPAWLREGANEYDGYEGYGPPARPAYPAGRPGGQPDPGSRSRNDYDDQGEQNGQNGRSRMNGQTSHTARRRQAPRQQPADQSWAAPDGYDDSPWGRSQAAPRGGQRGGQQGGRRGAPRDEQPAAKKRKGGFLGFLRRG